MTLALLARILLDPKSILQKREAHDLAHAFVKARRTAEAKVRTNRKKSRR